MVKASLELICRVYEDANKFFDSHHRNVNTTEELKDYIADLEELVDPDSKRFAHFANIEAKNLILVGYQDGWYFDAVKYFKEVNLGVNNLYLVESPQAEFSFFKQCNVEGKSFQPKENMSIHKSNIVSLLQLEPYALLPCANKAINMAERDVDIFLYVVSYLKAVNDNVNVNDFNDLVFFGGKPHPDRLSKLGGSAVVNRKGIINVPKIFLFNNFDCS